MYLFKSLCVKNLLKYVPSYCSLFTCIENIKYIILKMTNFLISCIEHFLKCLLGNRKVICHIFFAN